MSGQYYTQVPCLCPVQQALSYTADWTHLPLLLQVRADGVMYKWNAFSKTLRVLHA